MHKVISDLKFRAVLSGLKVSCQGCDWIVFISVAVNFQAMQLLETVEGTQNESKEPDEAGDAAAAGLQKREFSEGILGGCRKRYSHARNYKQKTRSSRIF